MRKSRVVRFARQHPRQFGDASGVANDFLDGDFGATAILAFA
ncbi:MAG TPA: hypothetical protein VN936_07330 [Candidatus Acidoferrum sp.]|nr:hypothetical protein [Candidatus Acidoferrum sp.]